MPNSFRVNHSSINVSVTVRGESDRGDILAVSKSQVVHLLSALLQIVQCRICRKGRLRQAHVWRRVKDITKPT